MERQTAVVQELPHLLHHQFDVNRFSVEKMAGTAEQIRPTDDAGDRRLRGGLSAGRWKQKSGMLLPRSCRCGYEWGQADISGFEKRFRSEFGKSPEEMVGGVVMEMWWPLQTSGWGAGGHDLSHQKMDRSSSIYTTLRSPRAWATSEKWRATTMPACSLRWFSHFVKARAVRNRNPVLLDGRRLLQVSHWRGQAHPVCTVLGA